MDPKNGASRFPFLEHIALYKPGGSTFMMDIASRPVICARIWG